MAGSGTVPDGSRLVWSVADGRRGRRWRAVASLDGRISHVLLLEVAIDGSPTRLELTTEAGMLTLHPDGSGRWLHGNVVSAGGVRHLKLPWSAEHGLEIVGRPIASTVTAHRLARSVAVGGERRVPVVVVTADLELSEATSHFVRLNASAWQIDGTALKVDERGIPTGLGDRQEWPLELD